MDIRAIPHPLEAVADTLLTATHTSQMLVMGAVNNHRARQSIHQMVTQRPAWWSDAGNEQVAGRVFMGNLSAEEMRHAATLDALAECARPRPLAAGTACPTMPLSCADLTAQDAQSLMMNQLMASIAAQYAADFVLHRRLTTYRTVVSLDPPTVTASLITEQALASFGISPASLMPTL